MGYRTRLSAARWVILSLLAGLCCAPVCRADLRLDLHAGLDNCARPGSWTPLNVRVTGTGIDASGRLQLTVRSGDGTRVYFLPLRFHAGPFNDQRTLYYQQPEPGPGLDMSVQLIADGRALAEKKLDSPLVLSNDQYAIAALAQDQSGLSQLNNVDLGQPRRNTADQINASAYGQWNPLNAPSGSPRSNPVRVLYPAGASLPDSPAGYDGVDVICLGDLPLDALSEDQWNALVTWVRDGGLLVVSGGSDINRARSKQLADILPIGAASVQQVKSLPGLAYRYGSSPRIASTSVLSGTLKDDAMALCRQGDLILVASRPYGEGSVVMTTFDLFAPEFRAWPGQARMWQDMLQAGAGSIRISDLVKSVNQAPSSGYNYAYANYGRGLTDALAGVQSTEAPSFAYIGCFLALYIICLVPLNYFLLRKLDRKELAWVTAPLIVLFFSTGAYAIGYSIKGGQLYLHYCSVVEGTANNDDWSAYTIASIFSPRQTRYNLSIDDPGAVASEVTEGTNRFQRSVSDLTVERSAKTVVRDALVNMWDHRNFGFESHLKMSGVGAVVTLKTPDALNIQLTNSTGRTLRRCTVSGHGAHTSVGDMAAGESKTVTLPWNPGVEGSGTEIDAGSYAPGGPQAIQAQLASLINGTSRQVRGGSPLVLTGWINEPVVGLALGDERPTTLGASLIVAHLPVPSVASLMSAIPPPAPVQSVPNGSPTLPVPSWPGGPAGPMGPGVPPGGYTPSSPARSAEVLNSQAYQLANSGDLNGALQAANRAMALAPTDGGIMDTVAEMHQRRKEYAIAAGFFAKALGLQSGGGLPETHEKYGETLLALGKRTQAIYQLRIAARNGLPPWSDKATKVLQSIGAPVPSAPGGASGYGSPRVNGGSLITPPPTPAAGSRRTVAPAPGGNYIVTTERWGNRPDGGTWRTVTRQRIKPGQPLPP